MMDSQFLVRRSDLPRRERTEHQAWQEQLSQDPRVKPARTELGHKPTSGSCSHSIPSSRANGRKKLRLLPGLGRLLERISQLDQGRLAPCPSEERYPYR